MVAKFKKIKKPGAKESIFFPIFLSLIFLTVIGSLVFSDWKVNKRRTELQAKIEGLKEEIQTLEAKKTELESGISQTEKESYWEEKIREEGYKKPGEEQLVILPPEENKIQKEEEKKFWNPQVWWEWLKEKIQQ